MLTRYLLSLRSILTEICLWVLLLSFVGGAVYVFYGSLYYSVIYGTVGALAFLVVATLFIAPFLILGEILETVKRIEAK